MYEIKHRVSYSEVNRKRIADMARIAHYFQDCTLFHSEDVGMGFQNLEQNKRAWFLSGWQIEADRFPSFGEYVTIRTWPYGFKGMYGYRNFDILDENEKSIVQANSIWIFMNLSKGRPMKPEEEDVKPYIMSSALLMEYAPRKIELPGTEEGFEMEQQDIIKVLGSHIDSNMHVNNAKYIELAMTYLTEDFDVWQLRVDYRKAAVEGDCMMPATYRQEEKIITAFLDENEKPYVIVSFSGRKMA